MEVVEGVEGVFKPTQAEFIGAKKLGCAAELELGGGWLWLFGDPFFGAEGA